jgi:hemerythrin-like metal-binding protein
LKALLLMKQTKRILGNTDWSVCGNELDQQQQTLVDHINKLNAFDNRMSSKVYAQFLSVLIDHFKLYFYIEERYMKKHRYPHLEKHKGEHRKFLIYILKINMEIDLYVPTPAEQSPASRILEWFVNHASNYDQGYKSYINEKILSSTKESKNRDDLVITNGEVSNKIEARKENLALEQLELLAHWIKTPANKVNRLAQLLASKVCMGNDRMVFSIQIRLAGEKLLHLANNLIECCKTESILESDIQFFDVNKTMDDLFSLYNERVKEKGIRFSYFKGAEMPGSLICFDEQTVKLVMKNLFDNALKYTESGKIEFGYIRNADSKFIFYVSDTGIGIKEEEKEKVFELFYHSTEVQEREIEGTGVGLAVVKRLVEKLRLKVIIVSEQWTGSFIWLKIKHII